MTDASPITAADLKRFRLLADIGKVGGKAAIEALLQEMHRRQELAGSAAVRAMARRLKLL